MAKVNLQTEGVKTSINKKVKVRRRQSKCKKKTQQKDNVITKRKKAKRKLTQTQITSLRKKLKNKPLLLVKILEQHGVRGEWGRRTLKEMRKTGRQTVVPWMSKMEWDMVKNGLFSFNIEDQVAALSRIAAWKSRCHPRIPLGIEVTAALIRAKVEDSKAKKVSNAQYQHDDIVMLYSMALIRFVNLVTEIGQQGEHNTPIGVLAERMGIPDWLVELRHEATHSTIPSLSTVRLGTALALEWIKVHYWKAEAPKINDLIKKPSEPLKEYVGNPERVHNLLRSYKATHGKVRGNVPKDLDASTVLQEIRQAISADRQLFVEGLIKDGIMFPPGDKAFDHKTEQIPVVPDEKLEEWLPLLKIISNASAMPSFLQQAIKALGTHPAVPTRHFAWIHLLLSALTWDELTEMTESVEKLQFMRKAGTQARWHKLLPVALKNPSAATSLLLPMLFDLTPVGERQRAQIETVLSIYCSKDLKDDLANVTIQEYRRVEDISTFYKTEFQETLWELCSSNVNWGLYPLGLLPSQIGAEVLNLDLPTRVDNLYEHKVQSWQRVQPSLGFQGKSEEQPEDYEKTEAPNLRARLLQVQHRRTLPFWSETEVQEVARGIVIF